MKKKLLAMVLTVAMCLMVVPATTISVMAAATQPSYTASAAKLFKTDSKTKEITLATGIKAKSSAKLTRTHIAAILTKVMNAGTKATGYKATNVTATNKDVIAEAIAMGIFQKTSAFSSTKQATRQEAVAALLKVFQAKGSNFEAWESVSDANKVPKATRSLFAYFANKEIINLSDDAFNPTGSITVGEFMKMVDDLAGNVITKKGTYTKLGNGNVTVAAKDVVLSKVNVKKNLTIADGVGKGDVTLKDTKVTGRTVVRGGGSNSIKILGKSVVKDLVVECVNSNVRIFADGNQVKTITVTDGKSDVIIEAAVENLIVNTDTPVEIKADIKAVTVAAKNAEVTVAKDVKVETVNVEKTASGTSVDVKGTVATLTTEAPKSQVKGDGKIEKAEVKADDCKVDVPGTSIIVDKEVSGTTVGDKDVAGGTTGTTTDNGVIPSTPELPPSGGGVVETPADARVGNYDDLLKALDTVKENGIIDIANNFDIPKTVEVNKDVTIRGKGNTIKFVTKDAGEAIDLGGRSHHPMFNIVGSKSVTINNITMDGTGFSSANFAPTGVLVSGGATVVLDGIRTKALYSDGTLHGSQTGYGVFVFGSIVTVKNSVIEGFNKGGIYATNSAKLDVENTSVTGANGVQIGINEDMATQNGIVLLDANSTANLNNVSISKLKDESDEVAAGLYYTFGTVTANNVTFTDVEKHAEILGATIVETSLELTRALAEKTTGNAIVVKGAIGTTAEYGEYTVNGEVTIAGFDNNAKVYGSFIVGVDNVKFENLAIENQYINAGKANKSGINAYATNLTVTNCKFTTGVPTVGFEPNGITFFPKVEAATLTVTGSTFTGFNGAVGDVYYSAGIFVAEEYPMSNKNFFTGAGGTSSKLTTPTDVELSRNTFTNCAYGYVRMDGYSRGLKGDQAVCYAYIMNNEAAKVNAIKYAEQGATIVYNGVVTVTPVDVAGVTLDKSAISLEVGATETLTETITPDNATNKDVTWTSSDTDVATVNDAGVVTAIATGIATITVTTTDGSKIATCVVTVTEQVDPNPTPSV